MQLPFKKETAQSDAVGTRSGVAESAGRHR